MKIKKKNINLLAFQLIGLANGVPCSPTQSKAKYSIEYRFN